MKSDIRIGLNIMSMFMYIKKECGVCVCVCVCVCVWGGATDIDIGLLT